MRSLCLGTRRDGTGITAHVVRSLFGLHSEMFGCTEVKFEQSPNKVSIKTGRRPEPARFYLTVS
ncbi:hypothetical protein A4H97_02310 [Niastella yeongjuensis]|uniref:Uncharacterized protein n=1 Tax=Niastella yeongjuensis TaxID=354355 RepID=A0A1V9EXR4_9BACT|nr:hypothetical protein A4H97_02310 [Niastella yeongjuensis]SEN22372.1 hypothetical protein SAMN05660816_00482 [Niastella yeongjuensis]